MQPDLMQGAAAGLGSPFALVGGKQEAVLSENALIHCACKIENRVVATSTKARRGSPKDV